MRAPIALVIALGLVAAGCTVHDASPIPNVTPTALPLASESLGTDPPGSAVPELNLLLGEWRRAPFALAAPQIAVISDACSLAARDQLGSAEADLPTALVDARGEGFVTAILADDTRAIQCLARLDGAGAARVDTVVRLAPSRVAPVADHQVGLTSLLEVEDRTGGRTLLVGRIGANASEAKAVLDDRSEVVATLANGWYATWWPNGNRATAIDAVDGGNPVVRTVDATTTQVDGHMGAAAWWLDPAAPAPTADSTSIHALVLEEACASGKTPKDRLEAPLVDLTETSVTVTIGIRPLPGSQDCQGNDPFPVTFQLPEPLAQRTLLDGNEVPPRDAAKPPTG